MLQFLIVFFYFWPITCNLLSQFAPNCGKDNSLPYRIVGGVDVTEGEHPWAVYLSYLDDENTEIELCTGTLITNVHVLTATHCFCEKNRNDTGRTCRDKKSLMVRLGSLDRTKNGLLTTVSEYKTYEKFDFSQPYQGGDLAIVKLNVSKEDLSYHGKKIQPVCLLSEEVDLSPGLWLTAIGWGKLSGSDISKAPKMLQKVELEVVNKTVCSEEWRKPLDNKTICTLANEGKDICRGDSGGPLLVKIDEAWYQVGSTMLSYRGLCGAFNSKPSIFVNLYHFKDWTFDTVKQMS